MPATIQVEDPREAVFKVLWAWFQELAEDEVLMEKLTKKALLQQGP